ncbi:MAG: aldo/keto reductase [Chloroflexi bacterium]|nr:aldo/keto reductase [Chloroflexota bacterium]
MEFRQLGNSGVRVSVIGLGTNTFGSEQVPLDAVKNIVDAAQDHGINMIDTADQYSDGQSEVALGAALKGRWDRFVVASKFYFPMGEDTNDWGTSRYHMMNMLDASLRRLQTEHIDLYYIHRWDENTPIAETMRALDDVVRMGKVRYLGASVFAAWQLAKANMLAELRGWAPLVVLQSRYNMLDRELESEVLPYCQAENIGFIPYSPLAGGFLTGKYKRGQPVPENTRASWHPYVQSFLTDANFDRIEALQAWCQARDRGLNELAQTWILAQPQVCSVISGSTSLEHVLSNVKAAEWKLSDEDLTEINQILDN